MLDLADPEANGGCTDAKMPVHVALELDASAEMVGRFCHRYDRRRFSGDPYFFHPKRLVEASVKEFHVKDQATLDMLWLHDAHEDHPDLLTLDDIERRFGKLVRDGVYAMTKPVVPGDPKDPRVRDEVKRGALQRLQQGPHRAVFGKMLDRRDNLNDYLIQALPWGYIDEADTIVDLALGRRTDTKEPHWYEVITAAARALDKVIMEKRSQKKVARHG